jgi:hypothetical protein
MDGGARAESRSKAEEYRLKKGFDRKPKRTSAYREKKE